MLRGELITEAGVTRGDRHDLLMAMIFGVGAVIVVRLGALVVIADAYLADETGTSATGALPIVAGLIAGIALLTASAWFFTKVADRKRGSLDRWAI